jgi:DNA polymerase III subunit gamma/tau
MIRGRRINTTGHRYTLSGGTMEQFSIKYRPYKFEDVVGNKNVKQEIEKKLKDKTFPQASLFSGLTGTGKTTLAQITAMSLNCENKAEGDINPCGTCPSCMSVKSGLYNKGITLKDATQMGKEDVKELAEEARASSLYGTNRIYIIDEADQLSAAAKAVFLKLLENPIQKTYFMLLSMEDKIPAAIKNRCQLYKFPRMATDDLVNLMVDISKRENIYDSFFGSSEERVNMVFSIARNSGGSVRQALQYFERLLTGEYTNKEAFENTMGFMDDERAIELMKGILGKKHSALNSLLDFPDLETWYNISWAIVSKIVTYHVTGYTKEAWEENQYKGFPKDNAIQLNQLFKRFFENSPYFKKHYLLSLIQEFYLQAAEKVETRQVLKEEKPSGRQPVPNGGTILKRRPVAE